MKQSLENFKPRLRKGRVIPHGAQIIFETENPYNKIILPMALADLILLCGGQFTVKEIVEKIYRKTGTVPFRWILFTIHSLHQGGFFDNADELALSPHLQSWVEAKKTLGHWSIRIAQRIEAEATSTSAFYTLSLLILVLSVLGLQYFPVAPAQSFANWNMDRHFAETLLSIYLISSLTQSVRFMVRGLQLLLLTGKVYNVSLRVGVWGLYLHVGDESLSLSESRLYKSMFHIGQLLIPWAIVSVGASVLSADSLRDLIIVACASIFWEINPFIGSEGRKFLKDLFMADQQEVSTWHLGDSHILSTMKPFGRSHAPEMSLLFRIWSTSWVVMSAVILHTTAIAFGPDAIPRIVNLEPNAWVSALGLGLWLGGLYFTVDSYLNKVLIPFVAPTFSALRNRILLASTKKVRWPPAKVIDKLQLLPIFSHFPDAHLTEVFNRSEVITLRPRFDIVREGAPSREVFVLLEGSVEVFRQNGKWLTELSAVSIFGEAALVDNRPREATVRSKTRCTILRVSVQDIRQIAEDAQTIRHLDDFRDAILINQFFASSPIFKSLSPESIDFLCSRGKLEISNFDQVIVEQGEQENNLYLILRGAVDVHVHGKKIKSLKQGSFFGEIALLANVPRTATIKTTEPSIFFKISADAFWEVLVHYMDLGLLLESLSEARLQEDIAVTGLKKASGSGS